MDYLTPADNRTDRREFLASAAVATGSLARRHAGPNNRVIVGVIGTGGRGTALSAAFQRIDGVEIACVCDVDRKRAEAAAESISKSGTSPRVETDLRRLLEDRHIDAVVVATCNHWHAPATVLACAAGKHVYVEKPCCHNPHEGELMVAAARKHNRMVQMGNQRRTWPASVEAIEQVRGGAIGKVSYAQAYYTSLRPSIGRGRAVPPPDGLDYDLWQGPAPRRPFRDNYLHYNWHWFWHWGNGELGNNGVHMIDVCRWGLGAGLPSRVTSTGVRYRFEDDQETPDTNMVTFQYPDGKMITWEGLSCNQMPGPRPPDAIFHGEKGSLAIIGGGYALYDPEGKELKAVKGPSDDRLHAANFIAAIRGEATLNSEIEEGHRSTLLCHLGNISYRVGRALECDPSSGKILRDSAAMRLWRREYEKGWEPQV